MAGITKYAPINGGNLVSDIGTNFSILRTKRTVAIAYAFVFVFIVLSIFLAFTPSSSTSSPWFTNIFTTNGVATTSTASSSSSPIFSDESYRSHFSSIYYYFFPNSTSQSHNSSPSDNAGSRNTKLLPPNLSNEASDLGNQTSTDVILQNNSTVSPSVNNGSSIATQPTPSPDLKANQSTIAVANSTDSVSSSSSPTGVKNVAANGEKETQTRSEDHKIEDLKTNQSTIVVTNSTDSVNNTVSASSSPTGVKNVTANGEKETQTRSEDHKIEVLKTNQSTIVVTNSTDTVNNTVSSSPSPTVVKNVTESGDKGTAEKGVFNNSTSSLTKKPDNGTVKEGIDDMIKSLMNCDLFDGNWVKDDSYPLYKPGSCSLIDEQFNCFQNGRPDNGYLKLKWKPRGCSLPRLDGRHLLEMLRGKRLVFVGDSLNRNMWESLICILKNSVKDQKKVYEEFGRYHFRTEASYSFVFEDYKCTVEFFVAPFLVQEWETQNKDGMTKETLRLDIISRSADKYKSADIIVFNTGHWWTHEKTSTGKDYYQEGSHVYSELDVLEAFRKALTTWGMWIDANVNPAKSLVFFRGYSASHFSGGQWNSGGQCDHETEPIKNETYLTEYPPKMTVLERVFKGMKTPVTYLNVTRLTDYRKDGHPSIYRKQHMTDEERRSPLKFQDCSHWCLPGVPDAWNELLYAELLVKMNQKRA